MVDTEDIAQVDVAELRPQFVEAFAGADYPVNNPMELLPALPDGPATSFASNGVEFSVLEIQRLDNGVDVDVDAEPEFPYETVDSLVDDLCQGIREAQEKL